MKINGTYKFRTKANTTPSLKICFLGQYKDREEGDTNFSFFIATPGEEIEEIVIENPWAGGFFVPKFEEIYLQNIGNKKTDWVATFKCTWDTSQNSQEGELKVLLGYKVGDTVEDEKLKEFINVETDPKYLEGTIGQRKYNTLHAIGNGFFTGNRPFEYYKYRQTASIVSLNDELIQTGSNTSDIELIGGPNGPNVKRRTLLDNATTTARTYPFYYYGNNGLTEEGIKPDYSQSYTWSKIGEEDGIDGWGYYVENLNSSCTNYAMRASSAQVGLVLGGQDPGESIRYIDDANRFNPPLGFVKNKFWLTPSVSVNSTFTASNNRSGSFATQDFYNPSASMVGTETNSADWNIENYSSFLTRNLTESLLFKNEESVTFSDTRTVTYDTVSKQPSTTGSTSVNRNYKTSVYLVSLISGEKTFLCEFETTTTTENGEYGRISEFWGRYMNKAVYAWDSYQVPENSNNGFYNYYDIKNTSYAHNAVTNSGQIVAVIEDDTPINIFMKAVSHRGKSVLLGNYLYYVENDVEPVNFGVPTPFIETDAFIPDIDGFLKHDYTLDILVFDINNIEDFQRKQLRFKPSKIPEGMENLTISKILAIQYLE